MSGNYQQQQHQSEHQQQQSQHQLHQYEARQKLPAPSFPPILNQQSHPQQQQYYQYEYSTQQSPQQQQQQSIVSYQLPPLQPLQPLQPARSIVQSYQQGLPPPPPPPQTQPQPYTSTIPAQQNQPTNQSSLQSLLNTPPIGAIAPSPILQKHSSQNLEPINPTSGSTSSQQPLPQISHSQSNIPSLLYEQTSLNQQQTHQQTSIPKVTFTHPYSHVKDVLLNSNSDQKFDSPLPPVLPPLLKQDNSNSRVNSIQSLLQTTDGTLESINAEAKITPSSIQTLPPPKKLRSSNLLSLMNPSPEPSPPINTITTDLQPPQLHSFQHSQKIVVDEDKKSKKTVNKGQSFKNGLITFKSAIVGHTFKPGFKPDANLNKSIMRHELSQFQVNLKDDSNPRLDNKLNGKAYENSISLCDRESTIEDKDSVIVTNDTINNGTNKFEIKKLQIKKKSANLAEDSVSSSPSSSSLASMSSSTSENKGNLNNGVKSKKNLIFYSVEDSFPQKKKKKISSKNNKMLSQNESMSRFKIIQSKPVESQMVKMPYGPPKTSRFFRAAHIKAEPIDLNSAVNSALNENGTATPTAATGSSTSSASTNPSSSNAHHYNPYLYAQNRNKANAPFDVLLSVTHQNWDSLREQIKANHINDPEFQSSESDFESIPILRPSISEFQDPTSYIESIRELGEKFGAVKILPPSTWHSKLNLNSELLWFKARRQLLNSYQNELEARIDFYKKLSEFHKIRKTPPTRLPSIDRRPLDLFKFRNNVRIRGGYEIVCQKKLWAQIGRELGYSGKITSSLSSSLKSAYQRVIYRFDLFEKNEREKVVKAEAETKVSENVKSGAGGADLSHTNESKKPVKFSEINLDCFKVANSLNDQNITYSAIKDKEKIADSVSVKIEENSKDVIRDDNFKPLGHATSIIGSSTTYERPRDLLISKGIPIYFDAATDHRLGVSVIENTIPDYNFNLWHKDSSVSDSSPYECKSTSLYNLKQFFEKGSKIKEDIIKILEETNEGLDEDTIVYNLENLFWKLLNDKKNYIEIESAFDLPTSVHNSAFPKFERFDSELKYNRDISISKWNLNNLPFSGSSIMQYINEDIMNLFEPLLNISMIYSSRSFHMQDHLLYTADFNHLGGSKVWYFISPEDQEKYEELIKNYESKKLRDEGDKTDMEIEKFYEILKNTESTSVAIENRIPIEVPTKRNQHKNLKFDKFISKEIPFHFNRDLFLSPKLLQNHGIKISRVVQNPGEFVIVFPKTYSSEVSMDSIVSESISFATPSWLNQSIESTKWLQKQGIVPKFSIYKLFISIINNCFNSKVLNTLKPIFEEFINNEIELRNKIRSFGKIKEFVEIDNSNFSNSNGGIANNGNTGTVFNFSMNGNTSKNINELKAMVTDVDLIDSFPSYIKLIDNNSATTGTDDKKKDENSSHGSSKELTMGLEHFIDNYSAEEDINKFHEFDIELRVFITDENLRNYLKLLDINNITVECWMKKYEEIIDGYDKPPLKLIKSLYLEGKRVFENSSFLALIKRDDTDEIMTDDVKLDKSSMEDTESSSSDKSDSSIEYKAYMEYELLKKSIISVEKWLNKANIVLQGRHQYRTRKKRNNSVIGMEDGEGTDSTNVGSANNEESEFSNNSAGSSVSTIEEIDALVKEIYELPLFVPEMEQFIEFVKEIELFETDARNFLNGFHHSHAENNGSVSVNNGGNLSNNEGNGGNLVNCEEEIEDLISTGRTFGINLDSVKLLERILSRRKWLNKINDDKYVKDIKLLKKLVEEGDSVCSGSDRFKLDNLKKLYDESISFNDQLDSIVDRYYIDIEKLKIIFYKDFERLSIDNELKEKIFEKIDEFDNLVELRDDYLNKINKFKESKASNNHVKYSVDVDEEDGDEESLNNKFEELSTVTISALPLIDLISKSLKLKGIDTDELNFELEKLHKWFEELLKIFKKVNLKKTDVTKTTEISSNIGKSNGNGSGSSSNGTSDEKLINKQLRLINENIKNIFEIGFKEDEDKIEDFYNEDSDYKINDKIFCFCRQVESGMMIECESCKEWFHFKCIGINENEDDDSGFLCAMCDKDSKLGTTIEFNKNEMINKIKFKELIILFNKFFKDINIISEEILILVEIFKNYFKFKKKLKSGFLKYDANGILIEDDINRIRYIYKKYIGCEVNFEQDKSILRDRLYQLMDKENSDTTEASDIGIISTSIEEKVTASDVFTKPEPEKIGDINDNDKDDTTANTVTDIVNNTEVNKEVGTEVDTEVGTEVNPDVNPGVNPDVNPGANPVTNSDANIQITELKEGETVTEAAQNPLV